MSPAVATTELQALLKKYEDTLQTQLIQYDDCDCPVSVDAAAQQAALSLTAEIEAWVAQSQGSAKEDGLSLEIWTARDGERFLLVGQIDGKEYTIRVLDFPESQKLTEEAYLLKKSTDLGMGVTNYSADIIKSSLSASALAAFGIVHYTDAECLVTERAA
jgi:hypothetical protein